MKVRAQLNDVSFTVDGKQRLCFTLDHRVDTSGLTGDLCLSFEKWREKRSKDANSYFHVLKDKIAEKNGESATETHNQLIADYGQLEIIDDHLMPIIIRDDINWRRLEGLHVRPTGNRKVLDDGVLYQVYLVMRGSHTYDTAEMARLIDGTISEAKELGIETATPAEKERMLQLWTQYQERTSQSLTTLLSVTTAEAK